MPLWPIPPILVFACLVYELIQQSGTFLLITLGVIVLSALYYFLVLRRRWPDDTIVEPTDLESERA